MVGYNANLQGLYLYTPKGGCLYAENASAEKAAQKKGAWLQKENVWQKRPQGPGSPQSKGQSSPVLLIFESVPNKQRGGSFAAVGATV